MPNYKVATGHGVALVSLNDMNPQPRTDATVRPVVRNESASGAIQEIGKYIELLWSMIETETQYTTLLAQFGLSATVLTNQVTIYVPNEVYTFARYNGIARFPQQGVDIRRSDYFIRDLRIIVNRLTAL